MGNVFGDVVNEERVAERERERVQQQALAAAERERERVQQRLLQQQALAAAERERERVQQQRAAAERSLLGDLDSIRFQLIYNVGYYIRTRRNFDGRDPCRYHCPLSSIGQDPAVQRHLNRLNETLTSLRRPNVTLMYFLDNYQNMVPGFECTSQYFHQVNGAYGVVFRTLLRGKGYAYGFFICGGCRCYWESGDTWVDSTQDCPECNSPNYPYHQDSVEDLYLSEQELAIEIDLYIRTRKQFNSLRPLDISVTIASIKQQHKIIELLNELNDVSNDEYSDMSETLESFIATKHRFITSSNGSMISLRYLTPFKGQDSHRVFGHFKCGNCRHNKWESAASWTNKWQKCKRCEAKCYPYEQFPLERSAEDERNEDDDDRRPHDCARCQRCQELGRICLPHRYYAV